MRSDAEETFVEFVWESNRYLLKQTLSWKKAPSRCVFMTMQRGRV